MSSRRIRDDLRGDRSPEGGVYCELQGGGALDGKIVKMGRRHDFITHAVELPLSRSDGESAPKRFQETLYEFSGQYRDCSQHGRVYLYRLADMHILSSSEIEGLCEDINQSSGGSGRPPLRPEDLLGLHGGDDDFDF